MDPKADVLVIGAGVVGLAAAAHLARRGCRVTVLDREHPGAGSTGRCIGGIRSQFSTPGAIRLMQRSVAQFRTMEGEFGQSVDYVEGGYLFLAHGAERLAAYERLLPVQSGLGLPVRLLTAAEGQAIVPGLAGEELLGGVYSPADGQAYPFAVVNGYVEAIRRAGGKVEFPVTVTGIEVHKKRVTGVLTTGGERRSAGQVLIAAGPWCREVGELAGLRLPVAAEVHEALITDRLPPLLAPMLVDYRADGCYFCQRPNGQVVGCFTPVPPRPGTGTAATRQFLVQMAKRMVRLLPALGTAQVIRQWGGCYEMTPDGSPILGETKVKGLFVAGGMSGHGFMFAPGAGEFMAELMSGGPTTVEKDEFRLDRPFAGSEAMK
jgi:sarcosine oxidase, subunit beta